MRSIDYNGRYRLICMALWQERCIVVLYYAGKVLSRKQLQVLAAKKVWPMDTPQQKATMS